MLLADVHRLFDAFLLTIATRTWTVHLAPQLHGFVELARELEGAPLTIPASTRPRADLLDNHRVEAERRAGAVSAP